MARLLLINAPHEGVNAGHHSGRKSLRKAPKLAALRPEQSLVRAALNLGRSASMRADL
jgi:hypothetical protein